MTAEMWFALALEALLISGVIVAAYVVEREDRPFVLLGGELLILVATLLVMGLVYP